MMSVPTVVLSGPALMGLGPPLMSANPEPLPYAVRLGRRRPAARPQALRFGAYFHPDRAATSPPEAVDYYTKAQTALARMYLNDQYGDCVIAGKMHALAVWSANDTDSTGIVQATDQEVLNQYRTICGPGDRGCVITNVLNVFKTKGLVAGGKTYTIDGYVAVDWRNQLEVKVTQLLFGATSIGINLPQAWTTQAVWDVTNTPIVGGHLVLVCGYDKNGVYVSSWGRLYLITWAAFTSTRWVEEYYPMLSPLWYGSDKLAPCGVDAATLKVDLGKLGQGTIPPLPEPTPPPAPPPSPTPPTPPGPATGQIVVTRPVTLTPGTYNIVPN